MVNLYFQDPLASYDVNGNDHDPTPRYDASNENKYVMMIVNGARVLGVSLRLGVLSRVFSSSLFPFPVLWRRLHRVFVLNANSAGANHPEC